MIKELLIIRLKQILRGISGIGLFRLLFLLGITGFAIWFLYLKTVTIKESLVVSFGYLILIALVHIKRVDKLFLNTHFSNYRLIMFVEYILLFLPVMIIFVIRGYWFLLVSVPGLFLVVNLEIKPQISSLNTKIQTLVFRDSFEWKAGLRKHFFIIVPVWCLAVLTSFYIGSIPVAIIIIGISIVSFYEKCESLQMLEAYELGAKQMLSLKIRRQLQLFSIITLPLICLFLLFNIDYWYIPLAEYLIFCSLHIYTIMTKYAFFEPCRKSSASQTFSSIGIIGGVFPLLLPVVWGLTIWFYFKSINNLNLYLNDYN